MSAECQSLSRSIWDGSYGWGRNSVLARAKAAYKVGRYSIAADEYFVTYASRLYSVVRDPAAWMTLHGPLALWRLYWLLHRDLLRFFILGLDRADLKSTWPAERRETLAAILLWASNIDGKKGRAWENCADALVRMGTNGPHTHPHVSVFLHVHAARLLRRREMSKRTFHLPQDNAPSSVEDDEREALALLKWAVCDATNVKDRDQQSHCYRAIAVAYAERNADGWALEYFAKMDLVSGVSQSVRRKNHAARRRWTRKPW